MEFLQNVDFSSYWNYDGSLTVPPCTEDIKWTVIKDVQAISKQQLDRITELLAGDLNFANGQGNNRRLQPLGKRKLYYNGALTPPAATMVIAAVLMASLLL